ncbi:MULTISPECIES: hypothetical protein [Eubacterium]|jgi:hypothetical protein|uniref:Uncharacterized protein n=1 Tax=Eubacterium ruminantium TaxID=42322 RepID=A0A1T4PB91_9FIRM|nr:MULTISPECIES: hypothetical protein [Eubacterium]MCR5368800.1 hypothetical protein [Eubacterium sp.]SCW58365.1 hypothetical protein SAMN05660484_01862 [Eubacterium ruminantium]SDM99187.1 hypothetical protein SAMN04490370_108123 [Eubacterium ruminantium]SJZ88825.1 hypothetical protein SAMN02745110_01919 [Eubacterium ruminantium]
MNNTTKQKYELAERMLKGKIPAEEVQLMTGLDLEVIKKLEEDIAPMVRDAKILQGLDNKDLNIGEILYDNNGTDEDADKDY